MPRPISLVLTVRDGKGKDAQLLINIINQDDESDISKQLEMARKFQLDIDALITGQVVRCGLVIDVPLDTGLSTSPDTNADIEQGALFIFRSTTNFNTSTRIPTFDETKLITGTPSVDLTDSAVADFVTNIIDGYEANTTGDRREVQDNRGDDITELLSAKQSFQRSRV